MLGILKNRDSQIGLKFCCILLIRHMPVEFHMRLKYQLKCFVFHIPCFNYKTCHELLVGQLNIAEARAPGPG